MDLNLPSSAAIKFEEVKEMDDHLLQKLVEVISNENFKRPFLHQAYFNRRLRTTGGRYHLQGHNIDINPKVFEKYGMEELINVIKHELCHYHLHLEGRGYKHRDMDFKELLAATGGSRFVRPLAEQSPENYHQYECQKCHTLIFRKRRMNTKRYVCSRCGGKLKQLM